MCNALLPLNELYLSTDEQGLYDDMEGGDFGRSLSSSLGLPLPNPAPDIDISAKEPGNLILSVIQGKMIACITVFA